MVKNYDVFAWETIVSKFRPFLSGFSILRLIGFGNCVSISIFGKQKNRHSFVISKKSLSMKHEYVLRFTLQKCEIYVWGKPHFGIQNIHPLFFWRNEKLTNYMRVFLVFQKCILNWDQTFGFWIVSVLFWERGSQLLFLKKCLFMNHEYMCLLKYVLHISFYKLLKNQNTMRKSFSLKV